jgi:hypothetical protein
MVFLKWLPLAFVACAVTGFAYTAVQQEYRQSFNDPQIQMVEDAQTALQQGKLPADVVPHGEVFDAGTSLTPFIAIFDDTGMVLESTASVDGAPLHIPTGVFAVARDRGEDRVTWQPSAHTRIALVVRPAATDSGMKFVAAGRNMRVVEEREDTLTDMMLIALIITLVGSVVLTYGTLKV